MQFVKCSNRLPEEVSTYHVRWLCDGLPTILGACLFDGEKFEVDNEDHVIGAQPDEWLEIGISKMKNTENIKNIKIPLVCKGLKCMILDCQELAAHKIGEENIWFKDIESIEYQNSINKHNDTTYVCHSHFEFIMSRDENYNLKDDRFDNK